MFYAIVTLGTLLVIAGVFDVKFLLAIFSYHNLFLEIFGYKGLRVICVILGIFLILDAIYLQITGAI